jgi:uncharacterized Zn finger protein
MSYYGFRPYVPVAKRRAIAARELEKLKKKGRTISPVVIEGRTIVRTFWGNAWCENLERYSDYENRLPRGRTYVRNGSVLDLQIERGQIRAMVSGSELYSIEIKIDTISKSGWAAICRDCLGSVGSLVELLQGKLSKNVMERVCREGDGLFPSPREIKMKCSCPDWADMCKHTSAVLYGVGARLDAEPDVLFALRGVDRSELIAGAGTNLPMTQTQVAAERVLAQDDVAALFGIDMELALPDSRTENTKTRARSAKSGRVQRAASLKRGPGKEAGSIKQDSKEGKAARTRLRDAKASPTLHGVRPERADAADNSAQPRIGREKGKSATQPSRSFTKVSKKESSTIELAAPASEPRSHRRIPTLAAKWTKWKKPKAR